MAGSDMLNRTLTILLQVSITLLLLPCFTACSQESSDIIIFERPGYHFPYQIAEPDRSWKLPKELVEISGVSFIDSTRLACVQDEFGSIYIFNLTTGKVESKIGFGDDGDYEGVEIIEDDAWVLKSNGTLYKVTDYIKEGSPEVNKYPTALSGRNNTEGICYDLPKKNLLIACKGYPFTDEIYESDFRAIYSFNTGTKLLDQKPFLLIDLDTLKYYKADRAFAPSGIAIQPNTGNIFILGSVGKSLLVFSGKGEMLAVIHLRSQIFRQPEGICFSPDGTLYISNEGDGKEGTILKFEPKNK
jgi:uncharacterized protein YjiK